jgi:hypothetical protein
MAVKHIRFYDEYDSGFVPMRRLYGKKYRRYNASKGSTRIDRRNNYRRERTLKVLAQTIE